MRPDELPTKLTFVGEWQALHHALRRGRKCEWIGRMGRTAWPACEHARALLNGMRRLVRDERRIRGFFLLVQVNMTAERERAGVHSLGGLVRLGARVDPQ